MKLIKHNQINQQNKHLVGNKGFKLAQLYQAGITISPFRVLPTSVFDQIKLNTNIDKLLKDLLSYCQNSHHNQRQLNTGLNLVNLKFSQYQYHPLLQKQLTKTHSLLRTDLLAVRSSASCEDGVNPSFAGQFKTYLSIPPKQILNAITKCYTSVFTNQVYMYCRFHQTDFSTIKMAVILQQMINADIGGVIFTQNIFNKDSNQVIIEAAKGLGENIVSGLVNPQRIVFDKQSGQQIIDSINSSKPVLTSGQAKKLYQIGMQIEQLFSSPQDIEWAIQKGKIFILQTRPIT